MQFKYRKFAAIVLDKLFFFTIVGFGSGVASMVSSGPGPGEYLLRWDLSRIVITTSVGVAVGTFMGVVEARHWLKSYWKTVHTLAEEGKDPASVYPPVQPRPRTPFWP